jgi:hypothetical protein
MASDISGPYPRVVELFKCAQAAGLEPLLQNREFMRLAANAEFFDQIEICLAVFCSDVLQETLALTNQL